MLDNAFKYEADLQQKFLNTWYDEKYKFWVNGCYNMDFELPHGEGDWRSRHFVSLNSSGDIIGYICYEVHRSDNRCCGLGALSFVNGVSTTFAKDLARVVDNIFCVFNHRKLSFTCITDNPACSMWQKYVAKAGGQQLCIRKEHTRLEDGYFYDSAEFEIHQRDYLLARPNIAIIRSLI